MCLLKKDVLIKISGYDEDDSDSPIEFMTSGSYKRKDGAYYISYHESLMTGMPADTETRIKVDGDIVTMVRNGSASNTQMVFQKGQKYFGHYETPYGVFTIGVFSDNVAIDVNDNGGTVSIEYFIDIDSKIQSRHNLEMNISNISL